MIKKIMGCAVELLTIAFSFFVFFGVLTIFGIDLEYIEHAGGVYTQEFFWGMACAAAFLHVANWFGNHLMWKWVGQIIIPSVISYFSIILALWIIIILQNLIVSVFGDQNDLVGLFVFLMLCLGCSGLAFYFQKGITIKLPVYWRLSSTISCSIGMLGAIYLTAQEANKILVAICFMGGFSIFLLFRVRLNRNFSPIS